MHKVILGMFFLGSFFLALAVGPVWWGLGGGSSVLLREVVWHLRFPEALSVALSGFGLGFCGVLLQGFFRNPLADPALMGISAGSAFAVVFFLGLMGLLGVALGGVLWALPAMAFFGAICSMVIMLVLVRYRVAPSITFLLAGIALSAFFAAVSSLIFIGLDNEGLHLALWWGLGGVEVVSLEVLLGACLILIIAMTLAQLQARALDVVILGEMEARSLGVNLTGVRRNVLIAVALSAGVSVALTGPIAFMGLMIPHLARRWFGFKHAGLLWVSGFLGAGLLLLSSVISRLILMPVQLPLGIVTSFLGVPFFIYFLLSRKGLGHAAS